jgi:MFS superfamily sulfate permease-like transporter
MMKNRSPILGVKSFFPIREWLAHYRAEWLRIAIVAVLSMLVLLISQSIVYFSTADVPAQPDLYAVLGLFLGYAFFVTSRQAITGPGGASVSYRREGDL